MFSIKLGFLKTAGKEDNALHAKTSPMVPDRICSDHHSEKLIHLVTIQNAFLVFENLSNHLLEASYRKGGGGKRGVCSPSANVNSSAALKRGYTRFELLIMLDPI